MNTINFSKKKMKVLLTKEQQEPHRNAKTCYICIFVFAINSLKMNKLKIKILQIYRSLSLYS